MRYALTLALFVAIIAPASLLMAPRPAHAQWLVFDAANTVQDTISAVTN